MLQMKKNFIGLAVLTAAIAGCQTAPKQYTDADFNRFDVPGYGAERGLAEAPGTMVLMEVYNGLKGVRGVTKTAAGVTRTATAELLQFVNKSTMSEVVALRNKYGKITEEQFKNISGEGQVKLAQSFLAQNAYKNNKNLSNVHAKVSAQADTLADGHVQKGASSGKVVDLNGAAAKTTGSSKTGLKAVLTDLIETSPALQSAEGRAAVFEMGDAVKKLFEVTGGKTSIFQKMACEVVQDVATVKAYTKMTNTLIEDVVAAGKNCTNYPVIQAAALVKFQAEMGRLGAIGRAAAKEMGEACPIVPKNISAAVDQVPENGRAPACAL